MNINFEINPNDVQSSFDRIVNELMNKWILVCNKNKYRIVELEIYYFDKELHQDPYVHCDEQQLNAGIWYFNGFGLDITFGNKEKKIYGGILIRGIKKIEEIKYINGPSNILKELFSNLLVFEKENGFYFEKSIINEVDFIPIKVPRIGLTRKEDDVNGFFEKEYRYLLDINLEHKFKDKEKVVRSLIKKGFLEVVDSFGILGYKINNINDN